MPAFLLRALNGWLAKSDTNTPAGAGTPHQRSIAVQPLTHLPQLGSKRTKQYVIVGYALQPHPLCTPAGRFAQVGRERFCAAIHTATLAQPKQVQTRPPLHLSTAAHLAVSAPDALLGVETCPGDHLWCRRWVMASSNRASRLQGYGPAMAAAESIAQVHEMQGQCTGLPMHAHPS